MLSDIYLLPYTNVFVRIQKKYVHIHLYLALLKKKYVHNLLIFVLPKNFFVHIFLYLVLHKKKSVQIHLYLPFPKKQVRYIQTYLYHKIFWTYIYTFYLAKDNINNLLN